MSPTRSCTGGRTTSSSTGGCCTTARIVTCQRSESPTRLEVPDQGLIKRKPMYELIEEPSLLEFLTAPEKHAGLFQELYR